MDEVYGPRNSSLLYLHEQHRSNTLDSDNMDDTLRVRRTDHGVRSLFQKGQHPHPRVMQLIYSMGFYGVYRCGRIKVDSALITALVERWRQETHTFHFRVGEVTITLQDIALLWGLPIDGQPVIGRDDAFSTDAWIEYCDTMLGFRPNPTELRGGKLLATALTTHLQNNPVDDHSSDVHVIQYTRALAFMIFTGLMIPDSTGNAMALMYLKHFESLEGVRTYSWGSATLAVLYRELCESTIRGRDTIGGAMQLLQLWAWSRICRISPIPVPRGDYDPMSQLNLTEDDVFPVPPYGARWLHSMSFVHTGRHSVRIYRTMLDQMLPNQFIWTPYRTNDLEYQVLASDSTIVSPLLWMSSCPLICYSRVEMHRPERVLRQFGMVQPIPSHPTDVALSRALHELSRQGRSGYDWSQHLTTHVANWQHRFETVGSFQPIDNGSDTNDGYEAWYDEHTRRFISPIEDLTEIGFQTGDRAIMNLVANRLTSSGIGVTPEMQHMIDMLRTRTVPSEMSQIPRGSANNARRRTHGRTQRSTTTTHGRTRNERERTNFTSTPHVPHEDVPYPSTYRDEGGRSTYRDIPGPSAHRDEAGPSTFHSTEDVYVPTTLHIDSPITPYQPVTNMYSGSEMLDLNLGYPHGGVSPHMPFDNSPIPYHRPSPQDHYASPSFVGDTVEDDIPQEPVNRVRRNRRARGCGTGGHL